MRLLRIWNDTDGVSHVEELSPAFSPVEGYARGIPTVGLSQQAPGSSTYLMSMQPGFFGDWHPAPRRQFLAQLTGTLRVSFGDGTFVDTEPGTLWYLEDLEGPGHQTRVTSDVEVVFLVVGTPEGWSGG